MSLPFHVESFFAVRRIRCPKRFDNLPVCQSRWQHCKLMCYRLNRLKLNTMETAGFSNSFRARLWLRVGVVILVSGPFSEGFSAVVSWSGERGCGPESRFALASLLDPFPNEFSRPLNTDRILRTATGKQRRSYRYYQTTIEATAEECSKLATRFELCHLESLKADLLLSLPSHYNSRGGGALTVQVEGSILATLTQTCVRTSENFEVTVEFPLTVIVKPVSGVFESDEREIDDAQRIKKKKATRNDRSFDTMELQQMIERQVDEFDFNVEEIVEDEAIYSAASGMLDMGELVSQTFWLNLDPYPKKPGSGPVEFTISG